MSSRVMIRCPVALRTAELGVISRTLGCQDDSAAQRVANCTRCAKCTRGLHRSRNASRLQNALQPLAALPIEFAQDARECETHTVVEDLVAGIDIGPRAARARGDLRARGCRRRYPYPHIVAAAPFGVGHMLC
jgi:hypothetical protein